MAQVELWHLKISLIEHQGHTLVRATHIRGDKLWNGKPYKDFDPKDSLKLPAARSSVLAFTESFGFFFPLPVGPKTWGKIMALTAFPDFEDWEKTHGDYSKEDYQHDLGQFWAHRRPALIRTHEKLIAETERMAKKLLSGIGPFGMNLSPQDQSAYARCALSSYAVNKVRLDAFWGATQLGCDEALITLDRLIKGYVPEQKQNKQKELRATREIAPKAKKTRKSKQVEGQGTLW